MPAANRMLAAFLLLTAAFLALIGFAAFELVAAGQHAMAAVVAVAGFGGAAAGAFTYWLVQRDAETLEFIAEEFPAEAAIADGPVTAVQASVAHGLAASGAPVHRPTVLRRSIRVQHMPVAELPAAYVDAVLRGAQAHLSALKGQGERH